MEDDTELKHLHARNFEVEKEGLWKRYGGENRIYSILLEEGLFPNKRFTLVGSFQHVISCIYDGHVSAGLEVK